MGGTAISTGETFLETFTAYMTGNTGFGLPAGEITAAFGYQWMNLGYKNTSDTLYEQGLLLGQGGPFRSVDGGYKVDELFFEANVPLLEGAPFAEMLTLDLAYRWSDYTTTGADSTYRIGLDWAPLDAWRVRAGYNRAVRAPSVNELFAPNYIGLWTGTDPCSGDTPEYTAAQCANTGVTPGQYGNITTSPAGQYNATYGGNIDLTPEEANTYTFGIVWTPMDTMTVSLDWWEIDIDNVIDNIDPQVTLEQCGLYGKLCDEINRAGNGSLWQGKQGWVWSTQINQGNQTWSGVDLAWDYGLGDNWNMFLIGTYMLKKETTPISGDSQSTYDCVGVISPQCYPTPDWRHTAGVTYDSNSWWAITGKWRYFSKVKYEGTVDTLASDALKAQNYFDVSAVFRFMETNDIRIGVNNIFDEEPPTVGNTLSGWGNANQVAGFYDSLGRFLYGNVTFRW
jgi:outer membrane receptor protein involved in Fe transport